MPEEYEETEYETEELVDTEDQPEVETEDEPAPAGNPSLAELYEVLPKSLHGLVEPVVNKWQSGIDREFETIAPYRKFAESGIDPSVLEASLELANQISANPRGVYEELAQRYGWTEAKQIMENAVATAEEADTFFADPDVEEDPTGAELRALKAEMEALKADRAQEAELRAQAEYENEIESTITALTAEHGKFDTDTVLRRAMLLSQDYPDADVAQLMTAAFEQYSEEVARIRREVKRAPRVAGGAGNALPSAPAPKLTTREERIAAIEEIAKRTLN